MESPPATRTSISNQSAEPHASSSAQGNTESPLPISIESQNSEPVSMDSSSKPEPSSKKLDKLEVSHGTNDPKSSNEGGDFAGEDETDDDIVLTKSPTLLSSRLRNCDVYIGFVGKHPFLIRYVNWVRAELELQGVSCFMADRTECRDAQSRGIAERVMKSATIGVVIITKRSFSNPYSIDEVRTFLSKKNLIPVFFGIGYDDCTSRNMIEKWGDVWGIYGGELWMSYGGSEKEWREAVDGIAKMQERKLHASPGNWRDCIYEVIVLVGMRLARRNVIERAKAWRERVEKEEFPFPRNGDFIGRKEELMELELILFGDVDGNGENECFELKPSPGGKKSKAGSSRGGKNLKADIGVQKREIKERGKEELDERKGKGKDVAVWKESEDDIEMVGNESPQIGHVRRMRTTKVLYRKGVACVSGISGIGKTELILEFAYRYAQRYWMVLWIGGETRYLRQNYMNLLSLLGVDVSIENQLCPDNNRTRSFEELEEEAIRRVRKELMRDVPFLLIIDNLEDEKDWWDRKNVMELLPRFGGETHVIISTRQARILNLEPLRLSNLPDMEAMSLMQARLQVQEAVDASALRVLREKLGGLTLGLALVGAILYELPMAASKLLSAVDKVPLRDFTWSNDEDLILRHNPFIVQLLDAFFMIINSADHLMNLAMRMVLASAWFAPFPVPVSLLDFVACKNLEKCHGAKLWEKWLHLVTCRCLTSRIKKFEEEASAMLVKLCFARSSTKHNSIHFHEIIKLYACKRGGTGVALATVQAINARGSLPRDSAHIWAASFLLFKFGRHPVMIKLDISELLSFTRRFIIPLAIQAFAAFSRCNAALELLRLCTDALEAAEETFVSQEGMGLNKYLCWSSSVQLPQHLMPGLYQELTLTKATLLETRAKLMLRGGEYDIGERLCRTAISIREVICGWDHHDTISARETMSKLMMFQANNPGMGV